jgi:regulator of sigma E protease
LNPGQPGDRGGLKADDRIVSVDGAPTKSWDDFVTQIQGHPGREMSLVVDRAGTRVELKVTPNAETVKDAVTGEDRTIGRIGAYGAVDDLAYRKVGFLSAVRYGARETVGTATLIFDFLWKFITGGIPANSVGSIVTIGEASGQAARAGLESFLAFIALFSINLAVLNILPIPVLDGGHLLFLAIEGIRRRPVSPLRRQQWSNVGLMILMGLMLFALYNDLARKVREFFPGMF